MLLLLASIAAHSQIQPYDSLAASDTLNWPQMQYLDSLIQSGARWQEHTAKLTQLGVVKQVREEINQVPEHIQKLDSLLQAKSELIQEKILKLSSNVQDRVDSTGQNLPTDLQQYASKMEGPPRSLEAIGFGDGSRASIDQLIEEYSSQLTNSQEKSWLQDQLSQLQQMDEVLDQYQGKLLDIDELEQLKGYQQQLQELTGQSQGYFREAMGLFKDGLNKDTLLAEKGPLMQKLHSLIGNRKEFQELQAQTAELEQFKQLSQKYGEDYARKHRQEAQQKLMAKAKEIGAGAFEEHQDKVQQIQEKAQN